MLFHLPLLLNVPYQFIIQLPFSPNNHILQQANNSNLQADQLIFHISYKFTGWPACFLFFLQVYRWTHIFSPFFYQFTGNNTYFHISQAKFTSDHAYFHISYKCVRDSPTPSMGPVFCWGSSPHRFPAHKLDSGGSLVLARTVLHRRSSFLFVHQESSSQGGLCPWSYLSKQWNVDVKCYTKTLQVYSEM